MVVKLRQWGRAWTSTSQAPGAASRSGARHRDGPTGRPTPDRPRVLCGPSPVRAGPDLAERIRARCEGRGADHAIEPVGRAETIRTAWSSTRRGGQTTVVGLGRSDDVTTFNALEIAHFARTLRGCMYGSADPATDIAFLLNCYRDGSLDLRSMVTEEIGLDQVSGAFDRLSAGCGARSVVTFC